MLEINGTKYNLCLLDTNALSHLLMSQNDWVDNLNRKFDLSKTIICYSIFTLSELWFRQDLFNEYLNFFSIFPSAILDGHESIFVKETENYHLMKEINPIVLSPLAIQEPNMSPRDKLEYVLKKSPFIGRTEYWKNSQNQVLDSIVDLRKNYPPKNKTYSKKEIEFFKIVTGTAQVGLRNKEFADSLISSGNEIDLDKLPSIKCTSYVVYYKFYPDNINPEPSDIFDIYISSLLPYVDYFVTEINLNHIVKQIQRRHNFLNNVNSFTMKQLNN